MAQLSAIITTGDSDFRSTITTLLRSSGVSIGIIEEKHASGTWPDLAVVDMRNGTLASVEAIERMRASWPSASIFAIAASAEPEQILQAMRAGANEYLAWPIDESVAALNDSFQTALKRTSDRHRPTRAAATVRRPLSFFGVKGGAGTTTLAVNTAIEIARTVEEADAHHRPASVHRRGRALPRRASAVHAGRRARQPPSHRRRVPARARREAQDRASTSSPAASRSTVRGRRTPRRSNSCCRRSAAATTTSSSTPAW